MIFKDTTLLGAYVVDLDKREDLRGFFARGWCAKEFTAKGLVSEMVQANVSFNRKEGTLRGLHYQVAPRAAAKLVRCIRGAIFDVMVDLRTDSPTYKRWFGLELTGDNCLQAYVPEHFAHGYITLENDSEVMYLVSEFYSSECERGVRYDDPAIGINWPRKIEVVSEKDLAWPFLAQ